MLTKLKSIGESSQKPNFWAYACLAAVCLLWGTTWVASTYSVRQGIPPMQIVMLRQIIAGIIILSALLIFHKGKLDWPPFKETFVLSILNFVFSNGLSTWGVKFLPAGLGSIIAATYPLCLVLIYYFFFNKEIKRVVWLSLFLSLLGLIIIFSPTLMKSSLPENFLFGLFLSIFSTITWSVGNIYTKKQNDRNINPYLSLSLQMIISSAILYCILRPTNNLVSFDSVPSHVWIGIFYLVMAGSVIGYSCFLYALKKLPAEQVSTYAYINPVVAIIISSIFMDEKITTTMVIGTLVVLVGLYLLNRSFKQTEEASANK
jgi:drug/metabolite transporter (DMT)-like permease